jgi:hypothetical protein
MTWRREKSCLYQASNSYPLAVQPLARYYTNYAIPALQVHEENKRKSDTLNIVMNLNIEWDGFSAAPIVKSKDK